MLRVLMNADPGSSPHLGMLLGLFEWGLASVFLLGLALAAGHSLRVGRARVDVLVTGFLWIFFTTVLVLLCGLAGSLHPAAISGLAAVLLAAGLAWHLASGFRPANPFSQLLRAGRKAFRSPILRGSPDGTTVLLGLAIGAQLVRAATHVWLLPPYEWDVLTYHLPRVAEWIQHHRLLIPDSPVPRMAWPANHELFQTWFALFTRHDFLLDAADLAFYLLAISSVYVAARSLGAGGRGALAAAVLYAYTPAVALHATAGKNDLETAALYLFCVALLLDARQNPGSWLRHLTVVALALALAAGTKPVIVFVAPGLALIALWCFRTRASASAPWSADRPNPWLLGAGTCMGLLLATYWYLRNLAVHGNPFYPTSFQLFGRSITGVGGNADQLGTVSGTAFFLNFKILLTEKIFDSLDEFTVSLNGITGWGWFVFAIGLPLLAYGVARDHRVRWLAAGALVSLGCLFATVSPDPWNMRFALWLPAFPAITYVLMVPTLRIAAVRWAFHALATLCLALNFAGSLDTGRFSPAVWRSMAELPVLERSTASLGYLIGGSYGGALSAVPPGETLGYNVGSNGWIYPLYGADFRQRICFVRIVNADVKEEMKRCGVRLLFVSRTFPHEMPPVEDELQRNGLAKIREGLFYLQD